jgi:predicted transcriptional regulator
VLLSFCRKNATKKKRKEEWKLNVAKLKGAMRERNVTQEKLSEQIGISISTLNRKLQSPEDGDIFTVGEAVRIVRSLNLSKEDAMAIFFAE